MIGLVEDGDLNAVEREVALLHQVFEATGGAGDDDVDSTLERGDLANLRHTTEDRGDLQRVRGGEGARLRRRSGWRAHASERESATRAAGLAIAGKLACEPSDHRDREGECLSAAGLSASEHVASLQCVGGERIGLDGGEGFGLALAREYIRDGLGGYTECSKCLWGGRHSDEKCLSGRVLHLRALGEMQGGETAGGQFRSP